MAAGQSDDDFHTTVDEMIAELGDEHSRFESPGAVADSERALAGANDCAGIGILIAAHPDKGHASVIVTFKSSPAELAGLLPHDRLLAVSGLSLLGATVSCTRNVCAARPARR